MKKGILIFYILIASLGINCCKAYGKNADYLKTVMNNLEDIRSANYSIVMASWAPGDTAAISAGYSYIKEINNPKDSTIGASYEKSDNDDITIINCGYDNNVKVFVYQSLHFRPLNTRFRNYVKSIIRYTLETSYSIVLDSKDYDNYYYLKLSIFEDRQVEFFGRAHHMPENPYNSDETTSVYEM